VTVLEAINQKSWHRRERSTMMMWRLSAASAEQCRGIIALDEFDLKNRASQCLDMELERIA